MKRISRPLFFATLLITTLFLVRCASESRVVSAIKPAFENFNLGYENLEVDAAAGGILTLENGTQITIPENAFIDEDGTAITGKVQLQYREFHKAEDIITAGIPMEYSENGEEGRLITAGMMEMRGTQNGKEVAIASGKNIEFVMPSYIDEPGVDFYALDENSGEWTKTGTPGATKNPAVDSINQLIEELTITQVPFEPRPFDPNEPVIRFGSRNRAFKKLGRSVWRYAGTDTTLNPFSYQAFNDDKYKIIRHEMIDEDLMTMEIELELEATTSGGVETPGKKMVTWFAPVFTNDAFDEAMAKYQNKEVYFRDQARKREEYARMRNKISQVSRSFAVSGFGFFNCDIFSRAPSMAAYYELKIQGMECDQLVEVFVVNRNGKQEAVLKNTYNPDEENSIRLLAEGQNTLLFVMAGDRVATIDQDRLNELMDGANTNVTINLDNIQSVATVSDVASVLSQI